MVRPMLSIDLTGKNAFVTGVADDGGFGWAIAKSLKAAGAKVYLASHPRVTNIVAMILRRPASAASRKLPYGVEGEFQPDAIIGCDVAYDTMDDMPEDVRQQKGYAEGDVSIRGALEKYKELSGGAPIDILIHAVAFSPEITKSHLETSRSAYLQALSISAYSLVGLSRAALPLMEGRQASVVGLSYLASSKVVTTYGGGMASAKAALECDSRALAYFLGQHGHRVNIVSPGPFPSRAAKSIGPIDQMIDHVASKSPLQRPITAQDVADTVVFLCSPLASAITAGTIYVDCGFNAMGV
jgi:enoyl-[acyl-carrier protein] reductase I